MNTLIECYTHWIIRMRWWVLALCFSIVLGLSYGLSGIHIASSFRVYFSDNNPQLLAFEELEDEFNKQDNVFFYIKPKQGDVFQKDVLRLVYELTEESWTLPFALRPSSLSNFQYTDVQNDDLFTAPLIDSPSALTPNNIARIKRIATTHPELKNNIIGKGGFSTGITVKLNVPESDTATNKKIDDTSKQVLEKYRQRYPDITIKLGGSSITNAAISNIFKDDLFKLIIISYSLFVIMLLFMLRSVSGMFITISVIFAATLSTFGLFNWLGVTFTPTQSFVPTAITTIAIADVVHVLVTYYFELGTGKTKREAIVESMRINAQPVFITSLSTAIGVLFLNTSDSPPYQLLGNMIAVGVVAAYLLSMIFLPALLAMLPAPKGKRAQQNAGSRMLSLSHWIAKHYRPLLWSMLAVTVLSIILVQNNIVTERWNEYFDESYEIRQVVDDIDQEMNGTHRLQYTVRSASGSNGIYSPEYLQQLNAFGKWLKQQPKVGHVESLVTTIKQLNQNLNKGDATFYAIPETQSETAQYFLLYEMSLPQGLGLEDRQNIDRSATRFSILLHKSDSEEMIALDNRATEWVRTHAPALEITEGTGLDLIFSHLSGRNVRSLIWGSVGALGMISILLMFALRSVKMGLISLVPNLVPILIAYGIWGLFKAEIGLSVAIVISISLGIVVDDTVHFLSKYQRARREHNTDVFGGLDYAFKTVGTALLITSAVLVSGFLVLLFSHFNPSVYSGSLLAMTIGLALIVDFLLLPPLLIALDKKRKHDS